jgi:3'-phosphoadenosine 5'-phosphosulfate sulfotransferase (PAPS reductase)/FAD synthetase
MSNPYQISEPTCISFSGGRTSAFMLHKVLEAHQMSLPSDAKVVFCNTGKEEEATLKFVNDCSIKWNVPIIWLEFAIENNEKITKIVDFETASRNGEPFDAVINFYQPSLPNGRSRYCSSQMKTRTMHRYLKSIGWEEWESFIGIRADEPKRVVKFRANPNPEGKHETVHLPLAQDGISSKDVSNFWKQQDFDLGLPNINGKTMHGNCDLCMLKPKAQILSLIQEKPERALWWIKQEEEASKRCAGDGKFFAIDRPTYAQMYKYAAEQTDMFDKDEEAISCFCGD